MDTIIWKYDIKIERFIMPYVLSLNIKRMGKNQKNEWREKLRYLKDNGFKKWLELLYAEDNIDFSKGYPPFLPDKLTYWVATYFEDAMELSETKSERHWWWRNRRHISKELVQFLLKYEENYERGGLVLKTLH